MWDPGLDPGELSALQEKICSLPHRSALRDGVAVAGIQQMDVDSQTKMCRHGCLGEFIDKDTQKRMHGWIHRQRCVDMDAWVNSQRHVDRDAWVNS